jgi:hypothetical protein
MSAKGKRGSNRNASARESGSAFASPARCAARRSAMATNRCGSWLSWQSIAAAFAGQCAVTSTQWVGWKPVPPIVSICR